MVPEVPSPDERRDLSRRRTADGVQLPGFFTVPECAAKARVSSWSIRKEIREGRLVARRIGRIVRITDEELARWMRSTSGAA